MASKAIKYLEEHQSETPSRFAEEAAWRKENAGWFRWSRQLPQPLLAICRITASREPTSPLVSA